MSLLALAVAGSGAASAEPVPDVSLCAATQLQVSAKGTPSRIEFRGKPSRYITNLNIFVTNIGPGPCYLMGAPVVTLSAGRSNVGGPYSRDRGDLADVQVTGAPELVLGPLLLPFSTSHQYAQLAGAWNAPYCGKPVRATVAVTSATGKWTAKGEVPSPPCRGMRNQAGTKTGEWSVSP